MCLEPGHSGRAKSALSRQGRWHTVGVDPHGVAKMRKLDALAVNGENKATPDAHGNTLPAQRIEARADWRDVSLDMLGHIPIGGLTIQPAGQPAMIAARLQDSPEKQKPAM